MIQRKLSYILKHYRTAQVVYTVFLSLIFRILSNFVKVDEKLVLFVSMMGKDFGDSPKAIFEYMQTREEYKRYHCVWAFKDTKQFSNVNSIKIDTIKYFLISMRAKYWITNTNIERGLHYKKSNQVYLNTWHGTPIKKIGNDCPGRNDFDFKSVTYLVVSGKYEESIFKSAFKTDGRNYLRSGMPRNDRLWRIEEIDQEEMKRKLGIPSHKKVLLYAPTWRESTDGGKTNNMVLPVHFSYWKEKLGDDYIVLFRAHHLTTQTLGVKYDEFVWDVSKYPDVNDLMIASDILVTDYSSIIFDFSLLSKPIFIYAYDIETYLLERGTYLKIEREWPQLICTKEEQVVTKIKSMDKTQIIEIVKELRDHYVEYGGNATEMCVSSVFGQEVES